MYFLVFVTKLVIYTKLRYRCSKSKLFTLCCRTERDFTKSGVKDPEKQSDNKSDSDSDSESSSSSSSSDSDDDDREPPKGIFCSSKFKNNPSIVHPSTARSLCEAKDAAYEARKTEATAASSHRACQTNEIKCKACPLYGSDLVGTTLAVDTTRVRPLSVSTDALSSQTSLSETTMYDMRNLLQSQSDVIERFSPFAAKFLLYVPACVAAPSSSSMTLHRPALLRLEETFREAAAAATASSKDSVSLFRNFEKCSSCDYNLAEFSVKNCNFI